MRKIMCLVHEFERDMAVMRMKFGRDVKKPRVVESMKMKFDPEFLTQHGTIKINGSVSTLERLHLKPGRLAKVRALAEQRLAGRLSLRLLAERLTQATKTPIGKEILPSACAWKCAASSRARGGRAHVNPRSY